MQDGKAWPEFDSLLVFYITFVKALRALDLLVEICGRVKQPAWGGVR
jgi:hypothetical protein